MGDVTERLLVVDDSVDTVELLRRNLRSQGYEVLTASNVAEALPILGSVHVDLVIADLKMPGASGLDLVRYVRETLRETEVMMITGYPSIEGAVAALKLGAVEYLSKPFTKEELFTSVKLVVDRLKLRKAAGGGSESRSAVSYGIVGECDSIQKVIRFIAAAAAKFEPILIQGEKGTGKELVANAIHYSSSRAAAPMITIHCGGVADDTLERQLFGNPVGPAGVGTEAQPGLLRLAAGGTLYFKELTELPLALQAKLAHMLEQKEPRKAESPELRDPDVALIADTSRDFRALAKSSRLRVDLFLRMSLNTIVLPPLRERGNDVLLLARHFLDKFARDTAKPAPRLADRALEALKEHSWPGNVAELEGLIYLLAATTASDVIGFPDLPAHMRYAAAATINLKRSLAEVEAEHIRNVVASVGGNKTRAVEILGINRKTLREKLRHTGRRRTESEPTQLTPPEE